MKVTKKKIIVAALALVMLLAVAPAIYYVVLRSNGDALWRIVSQQCLHNRSGLHNPEACLKVDIKQQYVLFKDAKGPHHDLLMPTFPIAGLESPTLEANGTPSFMAIAWVERGRLAQEAGFTIQDQHLSLAINSRWGRTQDHLHIHIACLQPTVRQALDRQAPGVTFDWAELPDPVRGAQYLARRMAGHELAQENPVEILNDHLRSKGIVPGNFGLGMVKLNDGDFMLLAQGRNLLSFDLGSIGEIQDFNCAVAKMPD